jgi:small subunit ribosomal protein S20
MKWTIRARWPSGRRCVGQDRNVGGTLLPHKKSTVKRLKQNKKAAARGRAVRSRAASAVKRAKSAGPEERDAALRRAVSEIDKAAKAGAIKKRTASRRKSRLMKTRKAAQ